MAGSGKGHRQPSGSLYAARWVLKHPKEEGEKGLKKLYRDLLERDPDRFQKEYRAMEIEYQKKPSVKASGKASKDDEEQEDLGTERCVELARRLIKDLAGKTEEAIQ